MSSLLLLLVEVFGKYYVIYNFYNELVSVYFVSLNLFVAVREWNAVGCVMPIIVFMFY